MTPRGGSVTLEAMFNLGLPELILIGAAALLVFGPKRLPELAKGLGKGIRDFKKALEGGDEEEKKGGTAAHPETLPPTKAPADTVAQGERQAEPAKTGTGKGEPG
jgi:sec-independent protein translocase protein TatA